MASFHFNSKRPQADFWPAYSTLWKESAHPTAFQAPHFIQNLCDHDDSPLLLFTALRGEQLIGAAFFILRGSVYHFLSDLKTDHNFFLLHRDITAEEKRQFFQELVGHIERNKLTFRLNNQPSWSGYRADLLDALKGSSLFHRELTYNACLVIEEATPEALFKTCNKQKLRQKMHRLEDQGKVIFEVLRGEEDLDAWIDDFRATHIARWAGTSTPSNLTSDERKRFFSDCIRSWIKDGIMVRFALKLDDKRIGFLVALIENGSLVHHSTTYDKTFEKQSPGLIIIRLVAKWVADQGMKKMEFGDGAESYKYMFTQKELPMHRILISSNSNIPYRIKTQVTGLLWDNPAVHRFYFDRVRPLLLRSKALRKHIT